MTTTIHKVAKARTINETAPGFSGAVKAATKHNKQRILVKSYGCSKEGCPFFDSCFLGVEADNLAAQITVYNSCKNE